MISWMLTSILGASKESPDMEEPLGESDYDHLNQSSSLIYSPYVQPSKPVSLYADTMSSVEW